MSRRLAALLTCALMAFGQRNRPSAPAPLAAPDPWVVDALALDANGRPVTDLTAADLELAPAALGLIFFYSFTKRFTSLSHLVLGLCLGIAPAAAWIAMQGSLDARILLLTAAVTFWTAGFDVIYSCQDYVFDCAEGLWSVPRVLGIAGGLRVARLLLVLMIVCLLALVYTLHLGLLAVAGTVAVAALLVYEHRLVKANDLSRVGAAFFTMTGYASVLFFLFWAADIFLFKPSV